MKKNVIKKNNISLKNKEEDLIFSSMIKRLEKQEFDSKKNDESNKNKDQNENSGMNNMNDDEGSDLSLTDL